MIATAAAAALLADSLKTTAWMVLWNPKSLPAFEQKAGEIDEIMLEWIGMDAAGMPVRRDHGTPEERQRFFETAKKNKVKTFAMISNFATEVGDFDAKRVQAMLKEPATRKACIDGLVKIVKDDKFAGIDLDIESLTAGDRENYSAFVEEASAAFHKARKSLSVTVHAKTGDPGNWDGPKAQDWAKLGAAADVFKVMTYDYSYAGGKMGPIAPNSWVRSVMTYAASVVDVRKIDIGIAAYGYDWGVTPTESLTWETWGDREKGSVACPFSAERTNGKAYFSGALACASKMAVAKELGIRGLAIWYVGSEDPAMWGKIKELKVK